MAEIVNNDKLTLILTQYGLSRVAEAMAEPSLNLRLSKIKFGSGNNYNYYTPSEGQTSLMSPIPEAEFYVYKKELLEDNLTISFYTLIPENIGGFDIREVGLYENVNGEDKLFAVGTCQPLVKPTAEDNYFMAVDYFIFLKAANFASIYDQIVLDPEHALITEPDLEEMMRTFLFTNANLIQQIGNNSRFIGYNRATQLYERITENKDAYGYRTLYKNYASVLDMASGENIFSYWAFDYSRRTEEQDSIVNLNSSSNYLACTVPVLSLDRIYRGFMPMLSMDNANFSLSSDTPIELFNEGGDIPFTVAFAIEPLSSGVLRTLLAKSNYATNSHTFEFSETSQGKVRARLYTDANNYLQFVSAADVVPQKPHSLVFSYNPKEREFIVYLNSTKIPMERTQVGTYTHMNELPGTLYYFSCTPTYIKYANKSTNPTKIYNEDGSPYSGDEWTIANSVLNYEGNAASYYSGGNKMTEQLYAWVYDDGENIHKIYTKVAPSPSGQTLSEYGAELYNSNYTKYTGTDFYVNGDLVVYRDIHNAVYDASKNPSKITLYAWRYQASTVSIFGNRPSDPTSFYENNAEKTLYTGTDWTTQNGNVYYLGQEATQDSSQDINTLYPDLTSYLINDSGNIANPIKANVGIISIIKTELREEETRALSLLLSATMGNNPYVGG